MIQWFKVFPSLEIALNKIPEKKLQKINTPLRPVCLTRIDKKFYVFEDLCPHNGASLSSGLINFKSEIVCPLHSYCFSISHGTEANNRCRDLEVYKIKADDSGFYIGIW